MVTSVPTEGPSTQTVMVVAFERQASCSCSDLCRFRDGQGVTVTTRRAHEQLERVDRKIRTLWEMLQRLSNTTELCATPLRYFSAMLQVRLMIVRGSSTTPTDIGKNIARNLLKLG